MPHVLLKEPKMCFGAHPVLLGVARALKLAHNLPRAICFIAVERPAVRPVMTSSGVRIKLCKRAIRSFTRDSLESKTPDLSYLCCNCGCGS